MRRLLIVGCGDIGTRVARAMLDRRRIFALTRSTQHARELRVMGVVPVLGDLDRPQSLERLAGIAQDVIHLAPPPASGARDTRTLNLVRALARGRSLPQRLVYMSTSGVYGDCGGDLVPESRAVRPMTERARRRVHAEHIVRSWGAQLGVHVTVLRVPGIYGKDRLPIARLKSGAPALTPEHDPYTNHVHADDLARIVVAALIRGLAGRAYNASDDSTMKMGEYFDLVADCAGLPHPPRISWDSAMRAIPETQLSFMRESRRLNNQRLKKELRVRLRYPSVAQGVPCSLRASSDRDFVDRK